MSNQQKIEYIFNISSFSETNTQSSSIIRESSRDINFDSAFINWFIGFTEGDGSFVRWLETNKISFVITQKDPKVLYYIKNNLGFGKIYKCKDSYYRYIVSD